MPNPALNEKMFERASHAGTDLKAGWAAPDARPVGAPAPDTISPWTPAVPPATRADTMTVGGVVSASAVLLVLLLAGAVFGWSATEVTAERVEFPGWLIIALLGGLGIAILTVFKPTFARVTAPIYAVVEGLILGAISRVYEFEFDNIVVQAVGLTVAVFALMLFLYGTRIIRVTDKLRMGIIVATGAVCLVYVVSLVVNLFGGGVPYIHDNGAVGILFSLAVVGIASFNLLLDFDLAERGAKAGAPKYMEWYTAFGLLVTVIWLYLELLRLLAKLRSR